MPAILGLGLAAAVYPQLLAVVVVILTRSSPRRLLWACYLAAFFTGMGCAVVILLVFRDRDSVAGSTSHRLGASVFLIVGVIAVLIAILMATERGRRLLGGSVPRVRLRGGERSRRAGFVDVQKERAQRALERGSLPIAIAVGMLLGLPGPFDLIALGRMARGGYAAIASIGMIIAFNLVKFTLIEIPIVSYAVDPGGTAARIDRFSAWMGTYKTRLIAVVVGVIGLLLIARGLARLG